MSSNQNNCLNPLAAFILYVAICIYLVLSDYSNDKERYEIYEELKEIRAYQDSLHQYYKHNHLEHYRNCAFVPNEDYIAFGSK